MGRGGTRRERIRAGLIRGNPPNPRSPASHFRRSRTPYNRPWARGTAMKSVRIGNGCGFWGDNLDAPVLLARDGRLDYLTLEYLAELTMSILALQKQRDPNAGFATDFLDVLERLGPVLRVQPRLRIITNAGGMNPSA